MNRLHTLILLLVLICPFNSRSQDLVVLDCRATADPMLVSMQRTDANNDICALVRVLMPVGGVKFSGNTVGDVSFDGSEYRVYLTSGTKFLQISCPGHYPLRIDFRDYGINSLESKRIYELKLKAQAFVQPQAADPGANYLILNVKPEQGVTIKVDGTDQVVEGGTTSVYLKYGRHSYRVEANGYSPEEGTVEIGPTGKTVKEVRLQSVMATLTVSPETPGCAIYVNDRLKGTGTWGGQLPAGLYRVEARKDGYRPQTVTVELSQRDSRTVTIPALSPVYGIINVNYRPVGASVAIDGSEAGTTPDIFRNITVGRHTVTVSKPGYQSRQEQVTVGENQTATVSGELVAQAAQQQAAPVAVATTGNTVNGHKYVDLGLSVKWAACNVGASAPEESGNYYAWGETATKAEYTQANSKTFGKNIGDISGNPQYDAARANWGGTWRMPTTAEFDELRNKCKWEWTELGGKKGYRVIGPNGNSIFLPAAGWRSGSSLDNSDAYGYYWSSTPFSSTDGACSLLFGSGHLCTGYSHRLCGFPVRPVSE
ncbi:PEGA domain-containing protein [uncultured Muribaculum sp.]|uniref:PEGA domain-containing protein n=1 Tax=uncultured Muribaculum sp. TaxID=1918613 RepID=UPI00266EE40C|nr:PEGA domain-containing protein [uncultured Muribaculum sp.]